MDNFKRIVLLALFLSCIPVTASWASDTLSFKFELHSEKDGSAVEHSVLPVACRLYRTTTGCDLLLEEKQVVEPADGIFYFSPDRKLYGDLSKSLEFSETGDGPWVEFEIDGDAMQPRLLVSESSLNSEIRGEFYEASVSVSGTSTRAQSAANLSIGSTIDIGCGLDMDVNSLTLGGVTRSSWPDGVGSSYEAGTALELVGNTFNVLDQPVRQWALESVELEGYVRPFDPPSCADGFVLIRDNAVPGWLCVPYEPGNSENSIRGWAREEAYDTPAEADGALAGLGYVKVNEADCSAGYVPRYDGDQWNCAAIPGGGGGEYWGLTGTSGTTQGIDFLGTSDETGLDIRINNLRALGFYLPSVDSGQTSVPASNQSPNIVAGYRSNSLLTPDEESCPFCTHYAAGRTISGGGMEAAQHRVVKDFGTIGGGLSNWVEGYAGTIGGGERNSIGATHGTVVGGYYNSADGIYSSAGGGYGNEADGGYSTIPGGALNKAYGNYSFAAGAYARVLAEHESTFVWNSASSGGDYFDSTGSGQFLINASGGVGIGTNLPTAQLTVKGSIRAVDVNGKGYAVYAETENADFAVEAANMSGSGGTGVYAYSTAVSGSAYGVQGLSKNEEIPEGENLALTAGVKGIHTPASSTGRGAGVWGSTASYTEGAAGVYGSAFAGATYGVYGYNSSDSDGAAGVKGYATGAGETIGVLGQAESDNAWAVYAQGNARVTGDLVVDGNIQTAGTKVISYGPEHWQARELGGCPKVKMTVYGTHVFANVGLPCYTAPELNTWLLRQEPVEWPTPPMFFYCTEPGVDGCGENWEKPQIGSVARMPLEIPDGVTLNAVKVRWATENHSPAQTGDSYTDAHVLSLYARPGGATGWWGFPNKHLALAWTVMREQNPEVNDTPDPFLYTLTPPDNTMIDNTSFTYFVDVFLTYGDNSLYEVYVEYSR